MLIIDAKNRILPALKSHGHDVEDFFGHFQSLDVEGFLKVKLEERKDVLLLDLESFAGRKLEDSLLARFNTYSGLIIFLPVTPTPQASAFLDELMTISDRVFSIQRYDMPDSGWDLLKNTLLMFWRQRLEREGMRQQMMKFSQQMDELIRAAHEDMHRAKKIHEDVVPRRMEELKGATLYSKYAVGEGAGSEYFDLIRGSAHSHMVFLHTNSYLASSCLMGILNKQKEDGSGFSEEAFLQEAATELKAINAHKKRPVHVELMLMKVEHGSFHCEGFCFGTFEVLGLQQGPVHLGSVTDFKPDEKEKARFGFEMQRGEKVVVFSPGFIFNWNEKQSQVTREAFWKSHPRLNGPELLMEMFFQLKRQTSGDFLAKDATSVMMEVNRHAIQQV